MLFTIVNLPVDSWIVNSGCPKSLECWSMWLLHHCCVVAQPRQKPWAFYKAMSFTFKPHQNPGGIALHGKPGGIHRRGHDSTLLLDLARGRGAGAKLRWADLPEPPVVRWLKFFFLLCFVDVGLQDGVWMGLELFCWLFAAGWLVELQRPHFFARMVFWYSVWLGLFGLEVLECFVHTGWRAWAEDELSSKLADCSAFRGKWGALFASARAQVVQMMMRFCYSGSVKSSWTV